MTLRLRGRFVLPTLFLLALGLTSLGFVTHREVTQVVRAAMIGQIEEVADALHRQVEGWLEGHK